MVTLAGKKDVRTTERSRRIVTLNPGTRGGCSLEQRPTSTHAPQDKSRGTEVRSGRFRAFSVCYSIWPISFVEYSVEYSVLSPWCLCFHEHAIIYIHFTLVPEHALQIHAGCVWMGVSSLAGKVGFSPSPLLKRCETSCLWRLGSTSGATNTIGTRAFSRNHHHSFYIATTKRHRGRTTSGTFEESAS